MAAKLRREKEGVLYGDDERERAASTIVHGFCATDVGGSSSSSTIMREVVRGSAD
jgi:hypothetical protein